MPTTTHQAVHAACTAQLTVPSPLGPMLLARSAQGLCGAWFENQKHHPGHLAAPEAADDPLLSEAAWRLAAYFSGSPDAVPGLAAGLPLDPQGSDFQRRVWLQLAAIPCGRTLTYGQVAAAVGSPQAVRAVGAAIGRNPVSVFIPCHRVVGGGGALTGYAGGLPRKLALLRREGVEGLPQGALIEGTGASATSEPRRRIAAVV